MQAKKEQQPMKTKDAIKHYGTQLKLCGALGLKTRQTIHSWGEYPPIGRQYQLEVMTNGLLKAERPDNSSLVA